MSLFKTEAVVEKKRAVNEKHVSILKINHIAQHRRIDIADINNGDF